jgi:hypothetical protein
MNKGKTTEKHHWWPECISKFWADTECGVFRLTPDGNTRRARPHSFGNIGNGHNIKLGDNPAISGPWDQNFENEFGVADSAFPHVIDWLDNLDRCGPPFERAIADRILRQEATDEQFNLMIECIVSLAVRSPMHREGAVALAEDMRGELPERERNQLIGLNMRHSQRNTVTRIGGRGKAMVIFSPEREFIFGDGFFHNIHAPGQHIMHPEMLVPLTPWFAVLFVQPMMYRADPQLVTFVASAAETDALNFAVQVYAGREIEDQRAIGTPFVG